MNRWSQPSRSGASGPMVLRVAAVASVLVLIVSACGSFARPTRDEAISRLDEAQELIEELLERADVEVAGSWEAEFLEDDNGCRITCSDCGQASRRLTLDVSRDRIDLEAALAKAAQAMGGRFEAAVSISDTVFFDAWLKGQSGREYLATVALDPGTVEVELGFVCYIEARSGLATVSLR